MRCTGRVGHSAAEAVTGSSINNANTRRRTGIWESLLYCAKQYCTVLTVLSIKKERSHAVFDVSCRAHGFDCALPGGSFCSRLFRGAYAHLHSRNVRDRRHRHDENLLAHDFGHEQAAVYGATCGELHDG